MEVITSRISLTNNQILKQKSTMNEHREIKEQLSYLLGFILLMEEKVEKLKQELAGHDEFDTRVAYLSLDFKNRGYFCLADLNSIISDVGSSLSLNTRSPSQLSNFFKRYGNGDRLTYNDFLKEIRPKMNIQLSQSLMVRNIVKKQLPVHIQERFELLMAYYLLLAAQSERLKVQIQSRLGINFVEIYQLMKNHMSSQVRIQAFFAETGNQVTRQQTRYLINHTRDLKQFDEWTEQQFKQIFTPVDSLRMFEDVHPDNNYYQFQQRSMNTQPEFRTAKKDNYLGLRFSNTSYGRLQNSIEKRSPVIVTSRIQPEIADGANKIINPPLENIDQFARNKQQSQDSMISDDAFSRHDKSRYPKVPPLPRQTQLDRFIIQPGKRRQFEQFEDDLEESQRSAFQYH